MGTQVVKKKSRRIHGFRERLCLCQSSFTHEHKVPIPLAPVLD